jgi:CTP:molybdopterin cytidylyltransferase MocA
MGGPKALVRDGHGTPWLLRTLWVLRSGGLADVTVVLGAGADEAQGLLGAEEVPPRVVVAADWATGLGASLRTGLASLATGEQADPPDAALVMLVDLPDTGADVIARVLGRAERAVADGTPATDLLVRARFTGRPGHPVVRGRHHWAGVLATGTGDRGARDYLAEHEVREVECGDLASGRDVDRRP